jgi:hypothetical protein
MQDERGVAECLIGLGCAAEGPEIAVHLFGAGFAALDKQGMALSPPNQRDYERDASMIRQMLGEERWRAAWSEGAALTAEAALALSAPSAAR